MKINTLNQTTETNTPEAVGRSNGSRSGQSNNNHISGGRFAARAFARARVRVRRFGRMWTSAVARAMGSELRFSPAVECLQPGRPSDNSLDQEAVPHPVSQIESVSGNRKPTMQTNMNKTNLPHARAFSLRVPWRRLVASLFMLASVGGAAQAQDTYYMYNGQRVPLVIEGNRLAVKTSGTMRAAGAEPAGLDGWSFVTAAAGRSTAAALNETAQRSDVAYATPIFSAGQGRTMFPDNAVLIQYAPGFSPEQVYASFGLPGLTGQSQIGSSGIWKITTNLRNGLDVISLANQLGFRRGVAFAEPSFVRDGSVNVVPTDPLFRDAWGLRNTGQLQGRVGFDMAATSAWGATTGSNSVLVAVFECGIQPNHPDLNLAPGRDFTSQPVANAGPRPGFNNGADNHGTWVAGCISGRMNNGIGAVGIAPGVRVVSVRFAIPTIGSDFRFDIPWLVAALDWSRSIGARVSNHSYALGTAPSSALDAAFERTRAAGMVHVASAGNSGASSVAYPASSPHVLAVGAANRLGQKASFSQYGTQLDFLAPGQEIITTDRTGSSGNSSGDYHTVNGTSFASPYAAGVAALVLSRYPSLSAAQVEQMLRSSCTDMGTPGRDNLTGFGLLNAARAVGVTPPPPPPPGDNNNTFETAVTVQAGGNHNEAISPAGDVDFYRVTLAAAGTLTVQTTGTTDTSGILYNSNRQQLASNNNATGVNFGITQRLNAGTYFVRVTHASATATGAYQFQARFVATPTPTPTPPPADNNNTFETAVAVQAGGNHNEAISPAGDVDFYRVTLAAAGTLTVQTTGTTDTSGILYNSNRQQLASNNNATGVNFGITQRLNAGTYFVRVTHASATATGAYQFQARFVATPTPTPTPPPADNNNTFETAEAAVLPFTGSRGIERAGDYDYYRITVTGSGELVVATTGSTDTFGALLNAQRQQLIFNDDSVGTNFGIRQRVVAGTYFILVRHSSAVGTGTYGLNVSFTPSVTPPAGGARRAVVVGVSDYLSTSISDLKYCDDDARAMRNLLQAEGWSVTTLIDSQATKAAILQTIRTQVAGASEFIFAFSGHGTRSGTTGYICNYDGTSTSSFISEQELVAALSAGGPGVRVGVSLDACHSGAFIDANGARTARFAVPVGSKENLSVPNGAAGVYFNRSLQQNGFTVLTACASSEVAFEDVLPGWNLDGDGQVGHGWLSYETISRLPRRATDRNGNGRSAVEEVFTFIAGGYQPVGSVRRQTPQIYDGDTSRHFEPVAATR